MVGDIYLGTVDAVLPGIQAAFVNIGAEKSAFLHASDLIESEDEDEPRDPDDDTDNGNGGSNGGGGERGGGGGGGRSRRRLPNVEIGRASCRERVEISGVGGSSKKKKQTADTEH